MIAEVDITLGSIIVYIIAGAIIGALARLVVPGKQNMSMVATIVLGIVAAVIGGILWEAIFPDTDVPDAFRPDVALNALVRERRGEFHLPEVTPKPPPTSDEVHSNKERWGSH